MQNWASQKTVSWLSDKLDTRVELERVDIDLLSHLVFEGLYIEDQYQDTLLYAGRFELNIGSINPISKNIRLKNILVKDGAININRTLPDSLYNFSFITSTFSSDKKNIVVDTTEEKSTATSFDFHLNKITIENTGFKFRNEVGAEEYKSHIGNAEFLINRIDLEDEILALEKIELEKVEFKYTSLFDTIPSDHEESFDTVHIALGDWEMETTQLLLKDCAFAYFSENSTSESKGLNFSDLDFTSININMTDILYSGDSIFADINQLAFKDKSGFEVDTFKTKVLFSSYEITCNQLKIVTPNSHIQQQFSMTYNTLNDFDRLYSDVRMHADLVDAKIAAEDLAYFTSSLDNIDEIFSITSTVSGSIGNLKLRETEASVGNIAGLEGNITIRGLPSIDETFIDVELDPLYANMGQFDNLIGAGTLPEEIKNLGEVYYNGRITGFVYNLVAFGDFKTSQGNITTDLNFIYEKASGNTQFAGKFNTTQLNVGAIAMQPELLGKVSMDATIDGGIINNEPEFKLESNIRSVDFNGYTYANIKVNGELKNKFFEGKFAIDDPNIVMDFNGLVDFSDTLPDYNFASTFRANLKPLHFFDEDVSVIGNASMKASGKSVDDLTGTASFGDLYITKDRNIYKLDTLTFTSTYENGLKNITAKSDLIDFTIQGDFITSSIPSTINNLIDHYTANKNTTQPVAQNLEFTINIKNADRLAAIFYPDVQIIRNVDISGNINTVQNEFNTRIRIQQLKYQNFKFDTILFENTTVDNSLKFFGHVNRTWYSTTDYLPSTTAEGVFSDNSLAYVLKIGRDVDSNRLDLHGEIAFSKDQIALKILPSEIYYNSDRWEILPNNSLKIEGNNLIAENFTLASGDQMISLSSTADSIYNTVLKLNIRNIPVDDLFEAFILPGEDVSGILNGQVTIGNVFESPTFIGGIEINDFTINDMNYGKLKAGAARVTASNKIKITAGLSGKYGFNANGFYTPPGNGEPDDLTLELQFTGTPLSLAEPFMGGIVSDLKGNVYGDLSINGSTSTLGMAGDLKIQKGAAKVDYIGGTYVFDVLTANIDKNKITIPKQNIRDELGNNGTLEGLITYSNFSNWNFKKFQLVSDKIELMKITKKENPDFWGYAVGQVDANITGPLDDLIIQVATTPTDSVFYLPAYGSNNVSKHDFIKFINKLNPDTLPDQFNLSIVNVDLVVNITPVIEAKILINSEGTEYLSGKGFGTLHITANTIGKVTIDGDLRITEGFYDFSFQNLFPRRFLIQPGGTIHFDGDPYKARFDLVASSTVDDVSIAPLTGTSTVEEVDVNVLVKITGTLETPEINFDLEVAQNSAVGSDVQRSIQQIKSDQNELNKQVFGLLITKNFLPADLTTYNPVGSTVNNTMNDFIAAQLSTYFSSVLNDVLKNAEVDVGIKKLGETGYTSVQGQQIDLSLKQAVTQKVIIKVGGTYNDLGATTTAGSASNLAGDFEVEFIITEDGRVRVKAFRVSEYDAIIAKNDVKTGVGIYYTKDFNKFSELFKRDENKKKKSKDDNE